MVSSTGERNGPGQCSSWGAVAQSLAGPTVEFERDQVEVGLIIHREVTLPGQVLPQEPVGVLARAPLPGALGITEVDGYVGCYRELLVGGHLRAPVPGHGGHHGLGQPPYLLAERRNDAFGVLATNPHQHHEPRAAFDQGRYVGVARSGDEVPLPVSWHRPV